MAVKPDLLILTILVVANSGIFANTTLNSPSRLKQVLELVKKNIPYEDKGIFADNNDVLISRLVKRWGNDVKISNMLANLENSSTTTNIARDYSKDLLSDAALDIQKLSQKYGYPLIKYKVVTEDGYKLRIYRISRKGPVVLLMHGLLCSSDDFMTPGPSSSLAYLLSDAGYDVWLGNARGNKHSRHNVKLSPANPMFWDFSWHEIGVYDLPAMIDFILKETGQKKLKYIGHSQGATSFYVMASERPEYNEKISIMISLSPVAYMSHIISPVVRLLVEPGDALYSLFKNIGLFEILPNSAALQALKPLLCGRALKAKFICGNVLFLIAGFDYAQLNVSNLPVIFGHIPSGAATKQIIHYLQGIASGDFKQFDYGPVENYQRYGSSRPPRYKVENIVTPVSLIYSDADWLSSPIDVEQLRGELRNVVDYHKVDYPFNHLDFIWAKDLKKILYGHLKKMLKIYD